MLAVTGVVPADGLHRGCMRHRSCNCCSPLRAPAPAPFHCRCPLAQARASAVRSMPRTSGLAIVHSLPRAGRTRTSWRAWERIGGPPAPPRLPAPTAATTRYGVPPHAARAGKRLVPFVLAAGMGLAVGTHQLSQCGVMGRPLAQLALHRLGPHLSRVWKLRSSARQAATFGRWRCGAQSMLMCAFLY